MSAKPSDFYVASQRLCQQHLKACKTIFQNSLRYCYLHAQYTASHEQRRLFEEQMAHTQPTFLVR